ncbi:glycosyltransferase family 2 protein [uncultured Gelidibacter sp.]|uniref:glycosyltransferase family 2 protein n=1 Tax=uncultured Gelidibacter sp. TaxID=259318 RepID=UPI00261EF7B7|nr:glycosyltransferase family 2 protein [uncultured Gelidibacter sp.]
MKVSVIIPVYNGGKFIEKSYYSIINQTLDDFEIIYVDNNSTDDSVEKILRLINQNPKVRLLYESKQGAASARNIGIKNALGTYIYVFDVDDEIYPNALSKMVSVLEKHQSIEAVFGKLVKSDEGIDNTLKPTDETDNIIFKEKPFWGLTWFYDLNTVVGPPGFLYRRNVFDKIGFYNEELITVEDTALDIRLGMLCNIAFLDTYVYLYFKHQQSSIEVSKREGTQIFHLWSRLIKSELQLYFEQEVPLEYKQHLFGQLFSTMGKIVGRTKGFKKRFNVYYQIPSDIQPIHLPNMIRVYLIILVFFPFQILLKFYVYYFSKWYVKNNIQKY